MSWALAALAGLLVLSGCESAPVAVVAQKPAAVETPAVVADDGSELFGAAFDQDVPEVALSALLAEPQRYAGQRVATRGTVSRVCKVAGCWMELRDDAGGTVRAPVAGHAYSLPPRVLGRSVDVQGTVNLRALTEGQKAHLRAEGALATEGELSLVASGVRLK